MHNDDAPGERLARIETTLEHIREDLKTEAEKRDRLHRRIDITINGEKDKPGMKGRLEAVERKQKWVYGGFGVLGSAVLAKITGWLPGN